MDPDHGKWMGKGKSKDGGRNPKDGQSSGQVKAEERRHRYKDEKKYYTLPEVADT
jgi:hypothetical protein